VTLYVVSMLFVIRVSVYGEQRDVVHSVLSFHISRLLQFYCRFLLVI